MSFGICFLNIHWKSECRFKSDLRCFKLFSKHHTGHGEKKKRQVASAKVGVTSDAVWQSGRQELHVRDVALSSKQPLLVRRHSGKGHKGTLLC